MGQQSCCTHDAFADKDIDLRPGGAQKIISPHHAKNGSLMSAETFARQSDVELINTFKAKGNDYQIQREEITSENFDKPFSERMTLEDQENEQYLGTARFGQSDQSDEAERVIEDTFAVIDIGTTQIRCGIMG